MTVLNETKEKHADKPHILVVDDDARICSLVSRFLHTHGFIALTAENATAAENILERFAFDALVVDVMMPRKTGLEFVQDLRARGDEIPVLLLTALGEGADRISGLQSGADDYLTKPFEPMELVLRLKSILRRTQKKPEDEVCYQIGTWRFDPRFTALENEDDMLHLTAVEANLLRALAESAGKVVSRDDLAQRCGLSAGERSIDVQVTRLRRKIEDNTKAPRYLQTVRGKGYLLRAEKV